LVTAPQGLRQGCAVSLRRRVFWVTDHGTGKVYKQELSTGNVVAVIDTGTTAVTTHLSADRKFLLVASDQSTRPLVVVNADSNAVVDTGRRAADVSVCDDGTIVSAFPYDGNFATYSIDSDDGTLTELGAVQVGYVTNTACAPGSRFVVAAIGSSSYSVRSFAVDPWTDQIVDSMTTPSSILTIAFNPATSDVYLLHRQGQLSMYAFDSNTGMFGELRATVDTGDTYQTSHGIEYMQFAFGKLFLHVDDGLVTYDATLNVLERESITALKKTAICVSEGMRLIEKKYMSIFFFFFF
jgi:6-phosphogluconolactonase (cycloisomerase 2 family)